MVIPSRRMVPRVFTSNTFAKGGRGVRKKPGEMNQEERAYHDKLGLDLLGGRILWHKFGAFTFKLAPDLRYTPDFAVMLPDLSIVLIDVKGRKNRETGAGAVIEGFFSEGDATVKIKAAAAMFPFVFKIVWRRAKRDGGQWLEQEVGAPVEPVLPETGGKVQ